MRARPETVIGTAVLTVAVLLPILAPPYAAHAAEALPPALAEARNAPGVDGPAAAEGDEPASADHDPIERFNRGVFWFNDTLDVYALEPVARGWDAIAPDAVQQSVSNFFRNLRFPVVLGNNLLQGKARPSAVTLARFMVNSTFGVAGLFDPARAWGLEPRPEDFGQTLGRWGTPSGAYLVLPLLGPSSVRDTGGLVVDYGLSVVPLFVNGWAPFGAGVLNSVNTRAQFLQQIRDAKEASLDYYVFVRNAYLQRRRAQIEDRVLDDQPGAWTHGIDSDLYDDVWSEDIQDPEE
jgi:phospholipid-binding lipoprotein MlaA